MRIMLAVDGSKSSINATRAYLSHLDWYRNHPAVRLVNVQPATSGTAHGATPGSHVALDSRHVAEGEKALAEARRMLEEAGIRFSSGVLVGEAAPVIVAEAEKEQCDLIYMGTRGMSALANLLLGSVATKVLHLSRVPVVLVK